MSMLNYKGVNARIKTAGNGKFFIDHVVGIPDIVHLAADNAEDLTIAFHKAVDGHFGVVTPDITPDVAPDVAPPESTIFGEAIQPPQGPIQQWWHEYQTTCRWARVILTISGVITGFMLFAVVGNSSRHDRMENILLCVGGFVAINLLSIILWETPRMQSGFRRLAVLFYPGTFLATLVYYWPSRYRSWKLFDETIVPALLSSLAIIVIYALAARLGPWIKSGFVDDKAKTEARADD